MFFKSEKTPPMLSLFCSLCTFLPLTEDYWGKLENVCRGVCEPVQRLKKTPLKISKLKQRKIQMDLWKESKSRVLTVQANKTSLSDTLLLASTRNAQRDSCF